MRLSPRTTTETVFASLVAEMFDRPIMMSAARTLFARHLVLAGLGDGFRRGTAQDIERIDGVDLAVRQSAVLDADAFAAARPATFALDDLLGDAPPALIILAWHGVARHAIADQRDPSQWQFAAIPPARLAAPRLDWADLDNLGAAPVGFAALRDETRRALAPTLPHAADPRRADLGLSLFQGLSG